MKHVPFLETQQLRLRQFTSQDESGLIQMLGDPQVMQFYGGRVTHSEESARTTLNSHLDCRAHDYWAWAITAKEDGRFVGSLTAGITDFAGERWFDPAWILARREWG